MTIQGWICLGIDIGIDIGIGLDVGFGSVCFLVGALVAIWVLPQAWQIPSPPSMVLPHLVQYLILRLVLFLSNNLSHPPYTIALHQILFIEYPITNQGQLQ